MAKNGAKVGRKFTWSIITKMGKVINLGRQACQEKNKKKSYSSNGHIC